ncbi:uncharacterized protein LOC132738508 [Ruditapes philippinarum]|uniref:uncharacterized protein LOC132738508 n=1 Tax=Ruditapes philippinarum TaxID=129788 RepID=UPI00295BBCEE|nr:uncharacterized protein LOC132738508 [Ruditapes philippinarum]
MNRSRPRFARRQVTKRTFNVLGSPNVLLNVQPDKNEVENEHTPQKQQKLDGVDFSTVPGDVSVSFLASTPKPGRPQLSRRRPMSPVSETLVRPQSTQNATTSQENVESNFTDNHLFKQQRVNHMEDITGYLSRKQMGCGSQWKRSTLKQSPLKGSPLKRTSSPVKQTISPQKCVPGSSIDDKIASISKSRIEQKRNNAEIINSNNSSSNKTEKVVLSMSKVRYKSVSEQGNQSERTECGGKTQKVSVPVLNENVSKSRFNQQESNSNTRDVSVLPETQISVRNMSSVLTGNTKSKTNKFINSRRNDTTAVSEASYLSERQESGRILSRSRLSNNGTSNTRDINLQDEDLSTSMSSKDRKSAVNRRLVSLSRNKGIATEDMSAIDQTMMIWETDCQKRSRSDLIDLDVVLNTVTETLAARMDVYDTDEEQSAVYLLEKYLTKDITYMIRGVQTVIGLQTKIKKSGQSIKQKQKSLMALQKERIEKEEKCGALKKQMKSNEDLTTITQFLIDLSNIIEQC